jgi:hypothetical protein
MVHVRRLAFLAALSALMPATALAADYTFVSSSADKGDPFDGVLTIRYDWIQRNSSISREFVCSPGLPGCPARPGTVRRAELKSSRVQNTMTFDARIGLYHDFELFLSLPYVAGDRTGLDFAPGVSGANSTVNPSFGPSLFKAGQGGTSRSGLGDLTIGLRWAPVCQWRDDTMPTVLLGFSYTAPTGKTRQATNASVGMGLHTLRVDVAASRRIRFAEPYFGLSGAFRLANTSGTTLFRNYDSTTQDYAAPGPVVGLTAGTEFYPWLKTRADGKPERFVSLDVGLSANYTFAGREQTDLFEALGTSQCARDPLCTGSGSTKNLLAYDRTMDGKAQAISTADGLTTVGAYGTVGTWLGVTVQPIKWVSLSLRFSYTRETSHLLTNAKTGENSDPGNSTIELANPTKGKNEFNPVYNRDLDDPGNRFMSEGANLFGVMLMLSGRI